MKAAKLLALLIICLAPLLGALFVYQARDGMHFITKNAGTLITPPMHLTDFDVDPPSPARWWLTYYTPGECDDTCNATLAHFATIQASLVQDAPRIGSLLMAGELNKADVGQFNQYLISRQALDTMPAPHIWLVDPLGNIVLEYDAQTLDNRILLDLRHLLKVSQIG